MEDLLLLGREGLEALGEPAEVGMLGVELGLLGKVDLLVLLLNMSLELTGCEELLVDPVLLTGDAEVPLLLGPDPLLPTVDRGEVGVEVRLLGEGGGAEVAGEPDLLVDRLHVGGEVALHPEALATDSTFEGLEPLVLGRIVLGQVGFGGEGAAAPRLGADEGDAKVDCLDMT